MIWLQRFALAAIGLTALCLSVVFYQQESATKYVMLEAPTVVFVVELPGTPTATPTRTPRPTHTPSITPTPWPVYGVSSPQPVMKVPHWTPTSVIPSTVEPEMLQPCAAITPDKFADQYCEGSV
jgi:hypothetical protein